MKKLIAMLLTVAMISALMPWTAFAASGTSNISDLPTGWNVLEVESFKNGTYSAYADQNVTLWLYKEVMAPFDKQPITIVQPLYSDKDTAAFKGSGEYASFTINKSADIYLSFGFPSFGNSNGNWDTKGLACAAIEAPAWVEDAGWEPFYIDTSSSANSYGKHNGVLLCGDANVGFTGRITRPYKRTVFVPEGEETTITLNGMDGAKNVAIPYVIFIDWKESAKLNFEIGNGGKVVDGEGNEVTSGDTSVVAGSTFTYTAVPDDGYYVKSVSYGSNVMDSSFEPVEFSVTPLENGENVTVEFSNEFDFSDSSVAVETFTDELDSKVKQKIKVSGQVDEFLKGKNLQIIAESSDGIKEMFFGPIQEDGSFEISNNTVLTGDVTVVVNLNLGVNTEVEVIRESLIIESTAKLNGFIDKLRDIENYSDADFVADLVENGESLGFDTELFVQMSETQQLGLVAAIKEDFVFNKIEDVIEKYNLLIPVHAVSNATEASLVVNAINKYEDAYFLDVDEEVYGKIYALYLESDENMKTATAKYLLEKSYTVDSFKTELCKNILLTQVVDAKNSENATTAIRNNISYFGLVNEELFRSYSMAKKGAVCEAVFDGRKKIADFDSLKKLIEDTVEEMKNTTVTGDKYHVVDYPDGWEVEYIDSFTNPNATSKTNPYAGAPEGVSFYLFGTPYTNQFQSREMTMVKAPITDKDSEKFTGSGEYGSFTINKSAQIYIAIGGGTGSWDTKGTACASITAPGWMAEDGFEPLYIDTTKTSYGEYDAALIQGDKDDFGIGGRILRLYKKDVIVEPGKVKEITLKGAAGSEKVAFPYIVFMEWKDNTPIVFDISEGGKVSAEDGEVVTSGEKTVFAETAYKFKAEPFDGYYVKEIAYGDIEKKNSFDAVEFEVETDYTANHVRVEFSNQYDFSSNIIKTKAYTDEADSNKIKKRLEISGKVSDFMKGKTLVAQATDESGVSEILMGIIGEDGTYCLEQNTALEGSVVVSVKLVVKNSVEIEVAKETVTIESMNKINAFIANVKNMSAYTDADFVEDLEENGEEFGFDTEIFCQMSQPQQHALIADIKNGFTFTKLEDLVAKYDSLIPVHAVSNAQNTDLIKKAIEKYAGDLCLTDEDMYGSIYALYTENNDTLKKDTLNRLTGEDYTKETFKTALCDSILLTEYKNCTNYTEVGSLIQNNLKYLELGNESTFKKFSKTQKNDTYTNILKKKNDVSTYSRFIAIIEDCIDDTASSKESGKNSGGGSGGGGVSLKPVGGVVTVSPDIVGGQPIISSAHGYSDVPAGFWATEAITYLVKDGVLDNRTGKFNPDLPISRAEFTKQIVIAYNLLDSGANNVTQSPFEDIEISSDAAKYIISAKNLGIINGTSEKIFDGDAAITRQDACVIILRALDAIERVPEIKESMIPFADKDLISQYAREAVQVLSECGIVRGDGTNFKPLDRITNAESAQLLYNLKTNAKVLDSYFESVVKKEYEILGDKRGNGAAESVDYGFSQGEVEATFIKEPQPHAVPGVINILYRNNYLYMTDYPFVENGRTLAPVRVLENFGMSVEWNGEENLVTVTKGDDEIRIAIGETTATVNGSDRALDVPAKILNGRTYVPIRFIAEALNMKVEWDDEEQTVILK